MEGKGKAKGIKGVMNSENRIALFRSRMDKFFVREMVVSVLISKFKLGRFNFD